MDNVWWLIISMGGGMVLMALRAYALRRDNALADNQDPEGAEVFCGSRSEAHQVVEYLSDQGTCAWSESVMAEPDVWRVSVLSADELPDPEVVEKARQTMHQPLTLNE